MNEKTYNPISVVVIAKNEAENLPRLLISVDWADEILVADTGSDDNTREVAAKPGVRVIELGWEGFGKTKQKAVEAASNEWILSLDADEEISDQLRHKLIKLRTELKPGIAYKIKRISHYMGKKIRFCGWQNDAPLRLFNRQQAKFNTKQVHEGVKTKVKVDTIKEPLYHYTYPMLKDHWNKMNFYTSLNVTEKFRQDRKYTVFGALLKGFWKFILMYFIRQGFRDGKAGFILCENSAIGQYLKYLKLWEKQQHDIAHRP
jgi:glycosyltransferase involved in cell wall biosynthesis